MFPDREDGTNRGRGATPAKRHSRPLLRKDCATGVKERFPSYPEPPLIFCKDNTIWQEKRIVRGIFMLSRVKNDGSAESGAQAGGKHRPSLCPAPLDPAPKGAVGHHAPQAGATALSSSRLLPVAGRPPLCPVRKRGASPAEIRDAVTCSNLPPRLFSAVWRCCPSCRQTSPLQRRWRTPAHILRNGLRSASLFARPQPWCAGLRLKSR